MYARVTTVSVQSDKIAETIRIYYESILPGIKAANGNQGVYLLMDEATGAALSITLWATEADGQAYDASGAYGELVSKVAPFFSAPPRWRHTPSALKANGDNIQQSTELLLCHPQ